VLYRPEAFEPLTEREWDPGWVRDSIADIVRDADDAFADDALWPAHEWDGWQSAVPMKNLYVGAAGVIWALDALRRRGYADTGLDLAVAAARALEAWRVAPDLMAGVPLPQHAEAALLTGETGILLVAWRLGPAPALEDDLLGRVRENLENDADDLMWGIPGTLLAAGAMAEWTKDEKWRDVRRESAEALWKRRDDEGWWTQRPHGEPYRGLGAPHGLVGNAAALLRTELDEERRDALLHDTRDILARTAVREEGLANWPMSEGEPLEADDGQIRVQWCNGAPGVIACTAGYLDEDLLVAARELVEGAGPPTMEKGYALCHGTSGNGYALLKAFERMGDEGRLETARRFAVHALEQVEPARSERGRGRYSLFTGDLGAALFAADCLDAQARFPVLDEL
jgi:hypothetical protein